MNWVDVIFYIIIGIVALRFLAFLWDVFFADPDEDSMNFSELTKFYESDLRRSVRQGRRR